MGQDVAPTVARLACPGVQSAFDFELDVVICHQTLFKREIQLLALAVIRELGLHFAGSAIAGVRPEMAQGLCLKAWELPVRGLTITLFGKQ